MKPDPSRCSSVSLALDEPMHGTASTVRNWLLLEQPGPWGEEAVLQSRLPADLARRLHRLAGELPVRVVLLRRPGRAPADGSRCYAVHSGPLRPWIEHARFADPRELLDVDLEPLGRGRSVGLDGFAEELFLVCTNGKRDPCCAERGRPLAEELQKRFGERVWECSHIGGDRFAANLVCFPHGLYFGRLEPEDGRSVAERYAAGEIDLDHYRGRSCYPFDVQAAEQLVRARTGLRGVDDLMLVARVELGHRVALVRFATASGTTVACRVRTSTSDHPRPLTCHARDPARPRVFEELRDG